MTTVPFDEYADSFPGTSSAFTRAYQVPAASALVCVNEFVVAVEDETPLAKPEFCDHSRMYAGEPRPLPESVEEVHVHVGSVLLVGDTVVGVPGTVGAVVSITIVLFAPSDPAPPGEGSVRLASPLLVADSLIEPPFSVSAAVDT